jgi:hypothetical protein
MSRLPAALALLLLTAPAAAPAADPTGGSAGYALGCALAKAVAVEGACAELVFFKREDERRIGEELAQLLDLLQRTRALGLLDAELAERRKGPGAAKDCPATRPLCAFSEASLAAIKAGLAPAK